MDSVWLRLAEPPRVTAVGVGIHGVHGLRDEFRLPSNWQLHLYGYAGELIVGDDTHAIRPGRVSLIPPDTEVTFRYRGRSEHLYAHFQLSQAGEPRSVPLMQDTDARASVLSGALHRAVSAHSEGSPQAVAELWTLLWHVANLAGIRPSTGRHEAVSAATAYIGANLATPLTVPQIARAAGVSPNHLTRLFRAETGETVVAYVRRRRLEQAGHLLRESTLSIAAVAATVGVPDLQAFNKACRRELGASPRAVRAGH